MGLKYFGHLDLKHLTIPSVLMQLAIVRYLTEPNITQFNATLLYVTFAKPANESYLVQINHQNLC